MLLENCLVFWSIHGGRISVESKHWYAFPNMHVDEKEIPLSLVKGEVHPQNKAMPLDMVPAYVLQLSWV